MWGPAIKASSGRFGMADFVEELGPFNVVDGEGVLLDNVPVIFANEVSEKSSSFGDVASVDLMPCLSDNSVNIARLGVNDFDSIDDLGYPLEGRCRGGSNSSKKFGLAGFLLFLFLHLFMVQALSKVVANGPLKFVEVGSKFKGNYLGW